MRTGKTVKQLKGDLGYKAFVPNFLPFSLKNDPELDELLSRASLAPFRNTKIPHFGGTFVF